MSTPQSNRRGRIRLVVAAVVAVLVAFPAGVWAADTFSDVPDSNTHHNAINAIRNAGITLGCATGGYCPADPVRRDQMASFMDRLGALSGQEPVVNAKTLQGLEPDDLQGGGALFAVVNADGTLARGNGAESAQRGAVGTYQVIFDRDVRQCAYTATVGNAGRDIGGVSPQAFINVAASEEVGINEPGGVFIDIARSVTELTDRPFHLAVFC